MGLIRLLLALSVIAEHCKGIFGLNFVGGQIAVQSFYIVSGFYMSLVLNEKYIGANSSFKLFITNRLMRLYPIYWTVLIITIIFSFVLAVGSKGVHLYKFESYLAVKADIVSFSYLIFTNLFIFGQDLVVFLGINPGTGKLFLTNHFYHSTPPVYSFLFVNQAWTLGLELAFYLIAPFILKRGPKLVIALIFVSFGLRLLLYNYMNLQNDPWTFRFFPTELIFFLSGYLAYRMYLRLKGKSFNIILNLLLLMFVLAFTAVYDYLPTIKLSWISFSVKDFAFFLTITLAIPVLFNWLKKSKWDYKIGELSYPIYIVHMLIAWSCYGLAKYTTMFDFLENGWAIAAISVVATIFLNRWIAYPVEKYRQARLNNSKIPPPKF